MAASLGFAGQAEKQHWQLDVIWQKKCLPVLAWRDEKGLTWRHATVIESCHILLRGFVAQTCQERAKVRIGLSESPANACRSGGKIRPRRQIRVQGHKGPTAKQGTPCGSAMLVG